MLRAVQCFELLHQPTQQLTGILPRDAVAAVDFQFEQAFARIFTRTNAGLDGRQRPTIAPSVSKAMAE